MVSTLKTKTKIKGKKKTLKGHKLGVVDSREQI